ncbi:MAG: sigma-70 family RNA polymerase sigma factor [Actinomycetota bacterium]
MARNFDDFFRASYDLTVRGLELDGTRTDDAHDAAQEAYVRAYARWWRVGHYKEPAAWVRRVAVNVVRDQHRHRTVRENAMPKLAAEPMTVPAVADNDSVDGLDDALAQLSPQQRKAVDLYYGAGFSTEEAASRMGISPGAFRFHLSRARRSLKPRMAEKLGRQDMASDGRQEVAR